MWDIFDFVSGVGELILRWRFFLCLLPAISIAIALGTSLENQALAWFIAVPVVLFGIGFGSYWERKDRSVKIR